MTVSFLDRCIFQAKSTGLGDFVVAANVLGYLSPSQASAVNGATYRYIAQTIDRFGNIQQFELGTGAYTSASATLARTTIAFSSSSNTKVNFIQAPQVFTTYFAEDVVTGPTSSVLNQAATFGDTTGKNLIDSKVTLTPPATGSTLTIADGKTFTASASITIGGTDGKTLNVSNNLTLAGTDGTTMTFPTTSATLARTDTGQTFTGTNTFGTLVATTINGNTITAGTGTLTLGAAGTLTIAAAKIATFSNTLTFTGNDGSSIAFGAGGTVLYSPLGPVATLTLSKSTPSGLAPGAGFAAIQAVAGSNAGTCKIIIYAGTSNTPITIVDNVGAGF